MKVDAVSTSIFYTHNAKDVKEQQKLNRPNNDFKFPSYNFYNLVSFNGGHSIDLAATQRQLDINAEYPPNIREKIDETLKNGNPENKTLIDVHKDNYSYLNSLCETTEDARDLYPEFEGVLSDSDVKYKKGSLIDRIKKGEVKAFDKDKEVGLQLLQLYWGEGFSLETLRQNYAHQNIVSLFDKFNIPRVDPVYGIYLKLSDKEYNERYTQEISRRARNIERKECGEDYIPQQRGPLSIEHKKAISEGLIKFHLEHPERIFEMSESRKQYYEEHPEVKEILSQVLLRAWEYPEGRKIRKQMSKFLKKNELNSEDLVKMQMEDVQENANLKKFWDKNPWAKDKFSFCMKKSWQKQAELSEMGLIYEPLYVGDLFPVALKLELAKRTNDTSLDFNKNIKFVVPNTKENLTSEKFIQHTKELAEANRIFSKDLAGLKLREKCLTAMQMGMCDTFIDASKSEKEKETCRKYVGILSEIKTAEYTADAILYTYGLLLQSLAEDGHVEFAKRIDENMNKEYSKIKKMTVDEAMDYMMQKNMLYLQDAIARKFF